jgi:hypothetical protein
MNVAATLVNEYLDLKEKLEPLEKRLEQVKNLLKDLVTEEGPFVDEVRGVTVYVEPRFRKEYDAERLLGTFPRLAECVKPAVDARQLQACLRAGMVTERELERQGVLTRSLYARAADGEASAQQAAADRRRPLLRVIPRHLSVGILG